VAIRILSVQDGPGVDRNGQTVIHRIVAYMVDDLGPFGLSGLRTELTPEEIRRRIAADADQLRQLAVPF
jgi:hypothetical protein